MIVSESVAVRSHLLNVEILTMISPEAMDLIECGLAECKRSEQNIIAQFRDTSCKGFWEKIDCRLVGLLFKSTTDLHCM